MPPSARRSLVGSLALAYAVFVALVGYWPTPVDRPLHSTLALVLARLHSWGAPTFLDYRFVEFTANIVFFVPVGLLLAALLARKNWWIAVVLGVSLSLAVEAGQLLFLPQRYPSLGDVVANSTGATIGVLVVLLARTRASE